MTRLLNPSPGEVVDRISILTLKLQHAPEGMDVFHFEEEKRGLEAYLLDMVCDVSVRHFAVGKTTDALKELREINGALWLCEDRLREHKAVTEGNVRLLADLCLHIAFLNDQRMAVVKTLNADFGITSPEKLHGLVKRA